MRAEITKTDKKAVVDHILYPSNVRDEEVDIFLRKNLVTNIMAQNCGFGFTIAYGKSNHGVTPFAVLILDPTTMDQLDISQQAEYGVTVITVTDNKNVAKGPPCLPSSYT